MGISETWLSGTIEYMYVLSGFLCILVSRQNKTGGGVPLYIPTATEYERRDDLITIFTGNNSAECIAIDLFLRNNQLKSSHNKKLVICEIYRPPGSPVCQFLESMECMLEKNSSEDPIVYIMWDLNINLMNCPNSSTSIDLLNLFLSFGFVPLVNRPTRVSHSSYSLIDILFTNDISRISDSKTRIPTCSISDHYLISHSLNLHISINKPVYTDSQKTLFNQSKHPPKTVRFFHRSRLEFCE